MCYLSGLPSMVRRGCFVQLSQPQVTPIQSWTTSIHGSNDTSPTTRKPTTPVHHCTMPIEKSAAKKENMCIYLIVLMPCWSRCCLDSPFPGFHDSFQSHRIKRSPTKKLAVMPTDNDRPPMPMSSQECPTQISSDNPFQDIQPDALPDNDDKSIVQAQEEEPVWWMTNWSEEVLHHA